MTALVLLALSLPCVYWTGGIESRATLESAGIKQICVPPDRADSWRGAGFTVTPITDADLAARERAATPGTTPRPGVASPTRAPWIDANGWRFTRHPASKYVYEVSAGKAALAAAEAFAYGVDAVLKIDPADVGALGRMLTFLAGLPPSDLPAVADVGIVDDGSAQTGEVMNLLSRRNLLFQIVQGRSSRLPVTIQIGTPEYTREEAGDPSAFAQKIRRQLTDERRSLRVYGSEVVICRLTADAGRARLHLINYGGRDIEGLRIRVRGSYADGEMHVSRAGRLSLEDRSVADGAAEFTVPRLTTYAIVDLRAAR